MRKDVLPFLLMFGSLIVATALTDALRARFRPLGEHEGTGRDGGQADVAAADGAGAAQREGRSADQGDAEEEGRR